jgi:hypothetical protein
MTWRISLPLWTFPTSTRDPNLEEIKILHRRLRAISIAKGWHAVQKANGEGVARRFAATLWVGAVEVDLLARMTWAPAKYCSGSAQGHFSGGISAGDDPFPGALLALSCRDAGLAATMNGLRRLAFGPQR